ncbi:MAG: hypothetical protein WKF83_05750 [Nocardioidaceae bacterium]
MKQALSGDDAETMARVRDMIADLNQLLAAHAGGHDTTEQFEQFMEQHGEFFPEQPTRHRRPDRHPRPPPGRSRAADAFPVARPAPGARRADGRRGGRP